MHLLFVAASMDRVGIVLGHCFVAWLLVSFLG